MVKTSNAQQRKFLQSSDQHQQAIVRILRDLSRTHGLDRAWSDWIEMGAIAMANAVDRARFDTREERYLQIAAQYSQDDLQRLAKAFAHLVHCWEQRVANGEFGDVLGSTFMMLDMGNAGTGQFFTPYEVSRLMGSMIMPKGEELVSAVERLGFLRLMEPASGAGGMIVAAAHALHEVRVNYQQAMHVTAVDIDRRCVHMTYLQLALLHIPAIVVHGNALTCEEWEHWYTPAHVLGGWSARLRRRDAVDAMRGLLDNAVPNGNVPQGVGNTVTAPVAPPDESSVESLAMRRAAAAGQMTLF